MESFESFEVVTSVNFDKRSYTIAKISPQFKEVADSATTKKIIIVFEVLEEKEVVK